MPRNLILDVKAAAISLLLLAVSSLIAGSTSALGAYGSEHSVSLSQGRRLFERVATRIDGLGPDFNATSCASCHNEPQTGGAGRDARSFVPWIHGDDQDALGVPAQRFTLDGSGRTVTLPIRAAGRRRTPSLFGMGHLEGISSDDLRARSDDFDRDGDGISGRLPWRDDCFGRFGWQSSVCNIPSFVEGALSRELGIETFPRSRHEISEEEVGALVAFVRSLPAPRSTSSDEGRELFARAQCAACHVPITGVATFDGRQLEVRAYTDLLIHEMGSGPLHTNRDSRSEFRTPPLWGIAETGPPYLHDGSARTVEQAIERHGGEAAKSRRLYRALTKAEQARLVAFVRAR